MTRHIRRRFTPALTVWTRDFKRAIRPFLPRVLGPIERVEPLSLEAGDHLSQVRIHEADRSGNDLGLACHRT